MPPVSEKQRRAMYAAAEGKSRLGIAEKVGKEFVSKDALSGAISEALAAKIDKPNPLAKPQPTELDIARAIQSGVLPSPQKFENLHLFDVRITGTGTSYRKALNEYVYRSPEEFLADDFVARCNGLPVVFEHPQSGTLDTDEYRARSIGTVVLPYVRGDEVWGIAKIYDTDAAELMQNTHVSTSPSVVFRDAGVNESVDMGNGNTLLIEGKPSYLDHLAICEAGVWDKGGEPSGVSISEEATMANEEKAPAWADALNKRFDEIGKRFDAMDAKRKDAQSEEEEEEEEDGASDSKRKDAKRKDESEAKKEERKEEREDRKDAKRKDGQEAGERETEEGEKKLAEANRDEKRKEKDEDRHERDDSARADSIALKARLADMEQRLAQATRMPTNDERDAIAKAYARADGVARMLADEVTHALPGESPIAYRKRLAAKFQKFSPTLKEVKLDSIDGPAFEHLESQIYADAQAAALSPAVVDSGRLIPIYETNAQTGQRITRWAGDMGAWMGQFSLSGIPVRIRNDSKESV
jgi:hypothetical protein